MPATPIYALPYPASTDPADVPLDLQRLSDRLEIVMTGRYRGALTLAAFGSLTGVQDGDIVDVIADATAGTIWRLRYRAASASAYKWEFIGGSPLAVAYPGAQTVAAANSFVAGLPSLTVPRAGNYICATTANGSPPTAGAQVSIGLTTNASSLIGGDAKTQAVAYQALSGWPTTVGKADIPLTLAASDLLQFLYFGTVANVSWADRYMSLLPVRIS